MRIYTRELDGKSLQKGNKAKEAKDALGALLAFLSLLNKLVKFLCSEGVNPGPAHL